MKKNYFLISTLLICVFSCSDDGNTINDPNAPVACFTFSEDKTYAGVAISFNAECSENAEIYLWDFGDDRQSTEKKALHTYDSEGNYTVRLIVTDSAGNTNETSRKVNVLPSPYIEHSGYIDADEIWEEGLHLIKSTVKLRNGSLTIQPGAEIYVNEGKHIIVGDRETEIEGGVTFIAEGTAAKPIIFKPASGSTEPGSWGNLLFTSGASDSSRLIYTELHDGGKGDEFSYPDFEFYTRHGFIDLDGQTVRIENTLVDGAASYGIRAVETFGDQFSGFSNNTIRNCEKYPIYLDAKYLSNIGENNVIEGSAVYVFGQYMASRALFRNMGVPYRISFELSNAGGGTEVVIESGTHLEFEEIAGINMSTGSLTAVGTATDPIVFTSAKDIKAPGDWRGINLASGSRMEHCIIEYGGANAEFNHRRPPASIPAGNSIVFKNNTIQYSSTIGLNLVSSEGAWNAEVTDNEIKETNSYGLQMSPSIVGDVPASNVLTNTGGYAITGGYIKKDVTWPSGTYHILSSINVINSEPVSLTISSGAQLLMSASANIKVGGETYVYGHLIADGVAFVRQGTTEWGRIHIEPSIDQSQTSITNCTIDGGGFTPESYISGMIYLYDLGSTDLPAIEGNTLKNSVNYGIGTYWTTIDVSNNTFSDNDLGDINNHN